MSTTRRVYVISEDWAGDVTLPDALACRCCGCRCGARGEAPRVVSDRDVTAPVPRADGWEPTLAGGVA